MTMREYVYIYNNKTFNNLKLHHVFGQVRTDVVVDSVTGRRLLCDVTVVQKLVNFPLHYLQLLARLPFFFNQLHHAVVFKCIELHVATT